MQNRYDYICAPYIVTSRVNYIYASYQLDKYMGNIQLATIEMVAFRDSENKEKKKI